jgi:hypothetical protein
MNIRARAIAAITALALLGGLAFAQAQAQPSQEAPKAAGSTQPAATQPSEAASQPAPTTQPAAVYPPGLLQEGLSAAGCKNFFDATGLRVYGHVETGFTGDLIGGQKLLPGRLFDARRVDDLRFNQLWLTLDRPYDATKNFDIGGRLDALYGGDALLTHPLGLNKLGEGDGENWFDPIQFYLQPWIKTGKDSGIEFTAGRYICPMGYESADATLTPLYSHSYLFDNMGPFTCTGAQARYIFNPQFSAYFAVVNGWDDFEENGRAQNYMTGGAWNSLEQVNGHSRAIGSLNVITGPAQPGNGNNYRTCVDGVFTYWWSDKLSQTFQADWATDERATPQGTVARWYGTAHYLSYIFNDYLTGTWRAEWFRDDSGIRMNAIPASWYEMTWGVTITPWPQDHILKNLSFRPEFRWDFADEPVFGGGRENQLTAAIDAVFKF